MHGSLNTNQDEETKTPSMKWARKQFTTLNFTQISLLVLAVVYTLYFIRPVLLPVILALLLSLILKPVHRFLCKLKIPSLIGSVLIVASTLGIVSLAIYYLLAPAIEYTDKLRDDVVKERLNTIFYPITKIQNEISDVASQVDKITNPNAQPGPKDPDKTLPNSKDSNSPISPRELPKKKLTPLTNPQNSDAKKELADISSGKSADTISVTLATNPINELFATLKSIGYHLVITFTLVYFLLAYGEKMITRITEVDVTAELMNDVTNEVSHYMFTITLINFCLGVAIGSAMWLLGMPNPILWGALAAFLNFIPYLGAIVGSIIVFVVAATTFDDTFFIILIPAVYYFITAIEGNFVTPAILGESFKINPIVVFLWVLCWGALWGIPGMLIGLPILMTMRIILVRTDKFNRLERIISS